MATYTPKASEITRDWHVIDAEGMVLGRMATEVARLLTGKHKTIFAPHIDTGDHVIVINADKVVMTSGKAERHDDLHATRATPGGIKSESFAQASMLASLPTPCVSSVRGMLPKGPLGRQQLTKLKVYAGSEPPAWLAVAPMAIRPSLAR